MARFLCNFTWWLKLCCTFPVCFFPGANLWFHFPTGERRELYKVSRQNVGQSSALAEFVFDFTYVTSFLINEGDSKATEFIGRIKAGVFDFDRWPRELTLTAAHTVCAPLAHSLIISVFSLRDLSLVTLERATVQNSPMLQKTSELRRHTVEIYASAIIPFTHLYADVHLTLWPWKPNEVVSQVLKVFALGFLQDAQLSQRDRAAGCVIVFAKSRRLELGDNILRTV